MNTITVSAHKNDTRAFSVLKYSNAMDRRYLYRSSPDVAQLTPLAKFLVENVGERVFGIVSTLRGIRVRLYNGLTQADMQRRAVSNGTDKQKQYTENEIKCYALENEPAQIYDWLFSVIGIGQSDDDYWNAEAALMISAGAIKITIGGTEWVQ